MKKWRYLIIASLLVFGLACGLIDSAKDLIPDEDDAAELVEGLVEDVMDEMDDTSDDDDVHTDDDDDDDDDEVHTEDDDVDESDDDESSDDGTIVLDDDAFDNLDSYRMELYFEMNFADGSQELLDMKVSTTRDPLAYQIVMLSDGEEIEMIQIEDAVWIRFGEEWIASTSEDGGADDFTDFSITAEDLDIESWDSDDYDYLGKEDVNGIKTRHYEAKYNETWMGFFQEEEMGEIEDATAHFWIADERDLPKFVVKMDFTVEGELDDEATSWVMTQAVYDINESITIEAPEGVTTGLPEGVPEYPNATDFASFGGMVTFVTEDAVEDVAEFYTSALEDAGWTQEESSELGGMITASYTKDGQTLSMMIMADESSGGTSVLITVE